MKPDKNSELLLPWLHNDTLDGEEKALAIEYERNLQEAGAAEKKFDELIEAVIKKQGVDSPGEFGWFRLQRDMEMLEKVKSGSSKTGRWFKPAMAAAIFVIFFQGGFILNRLNEPVTYAPLGQQQEFPVVLQLEFQPTATAESIRILLTKVDGRVIDGPGAVGIYRVSLNLSAQDEEEIENRINVLRNYSSVVSHVSRD